LEELLTSDLKIEELHRSVERLREVVAGLVPSLERVVPACVEEYCDKMREYQVKEGDSIVALAERRVNK
jgi:hypothetical protein